MQLRSHVAVAVAVASGYNSDWTPSLGTSISRRCGPTNAKKKKKKKIYAQFSGHFCSPHPPVDVLTHELNLKITLGGRYNLSPFKGENIASERLPVLS